MFDFFKRKEPDQGVLSNLKTVSRWVEALPAGDVFSAQEKVVQQLIQFNHAKKGFGKDRLLVLMHLDEETQEMQASLCMQYLRNARMSKSIEARLWMAIHAFYWEITRSYHGFLMDFVANPGGSRIQAQIPLVTARAIRGFANIIKWRYFRYEKIDEKVWLRLHNLYRIAEFDNFADTRVTVYRADPNPHSPAQEYGHALLLSLFGSGNLLPREIEMVDRWLDNWSDLIHIDTQHQPDRHSFAVDTAKGYGLRRVRGPGSEASLRYLATEALVERVAKSREALRAGQPAATLGLTEDFRLPEGYALLNQVETEWLSENPSDRRRNSRLSRSGDWKVVHGLANIANELERQGSVGHTGHQGQPRAEEILDIKLYGFVTQRTKDKLLERDRAAIPGGHHEIWQQHDASETGIGFMVDHLETDWVEVGRLIAVAGGDGSPWQPGVISRLARQDDGTRLVGVRLFGEACQAAHIKPETAPHATTYVVDDPAAAPPAQAAPALLLTGEEGAESLVIDSAKYARDRQYLLRTPHAPDRMIRLEAVQESGDVWHRADFRVVAA